MKAIYGGHWSGYAVCDVSPNRWETAVMSLDNATVSQGKGFRRSTLTVEDGAFLDG